MTLSSIPFVYHLWTELGNTTVVMAARSLVTRALSKPKVRVLLTCDPRRHASAIAVPTTTAPENMEHDVAVRLDNPFQSRWRLLMEGRKKRLFPILTLRPIPQRLPNSANISHIWLLHTYGRPH